MNMWELSAPQKEILQFEMEEECGCINNICGIYEVQGTNSDDKLQDALNALIYNEQALRLCFTEQDGKYYQYEMPYKKQVFPILDWTELSETEKMQECKKIAEVPFEIWNKELYRFRIIKIGEKRNIIFLVHHLIADGHSMGLLGKHLERVIDGHKLTHHCYTDFVVKEEKLKESERYIRDKKYWEEVFCDFKSPALVATEANEDEEIYGARYEKELTEEEVNELKAFCTSHNCSPVTPFAAALFVYMKRRNPDKKTIEIGQMTLDRKGIKERETVGNYASELLLCVDVKKDDTWKSLMDRIEKTTREAFHHSLIRHDDIIELLSKNRPQITKIRDLEFGYLPPVYSDGKEYSGYWIANETPETTVECNLFHMKKDSEMKIIWDYQLTAMSKKEAEESVDEVLTLLLDSIRGEKNRIEE